MKLLLKQLKKEPSNITVIFQLERNIKSHWAMYSGDREYNNLVFSSVFSDLLLKLDKSEINTPRDVLNYFSNNYRKCFDELSKTIHRVDGVTHSEVVKRSLIDFSNLSFSEYLVFYKYLNDKILTPQVNLILAKLKYNSKITDESVLKRLANENYVTMYLSNELGSKKFMDFCDLIDKLGIYYPMVNVPDQELLIKLKDGILQKYLTSISTSKIDNLSKLEQFLFNT